MTIASPSRFVVADINGSVENSRDFHRWRAKIFEKDHQGTTARQPSLERDGWEAVIRLCQRPGIISRRKPLKYSVSGMVGRTG